MTTYIGRIGGMVPVGCVSDQGVGSEQRAVFGGGEGTLSPRRVRLQGPGGRAWEMSVGVRDLSAMNAVHSLARRQALYGGSYRVIPCDAVDHNMFTPRASEELWDWTGLSVGPAESFPTVAPGEAVGAMMFGRVALGQAANSPVVPLPKVARLWAYAHVAGVGELTIRYRSAGGATTDHVMPFSLPSSSLSRFGGTALMLGGHVSVEVLIRTTIEAPVRFAWPSIAYADNPYVTGRGCDKAYLSMPSRDLIGTWGTGLESHSYQIVEVGA